MQVPFTDIKKRLATIDGASYDELARLLDMKYATLVAKINGHRDFTPDEMSKVLTILSMLENAAIRNPVSEKLSRIR
jgi:hypothetical protein